MKPFKKLRVELAVNEIEQQDIAKLIGRSVFYVSARMTGKAPWTLPEAYIICNRLDIPLEQLLDLFPLSDVLNTARTEEFEGGKAS